MMRFANIQPIGYVTDGNIERYCAERGVPWADVRFDSSAEADHIEYRGLFGINRRDHLSHSLRIKKRTLVYIMNVDEGKLVGDETDRLKVRLVGHGKYHHATYGILVNRIRPRYPLFSLLNFDNHPDMGNSDGWDEGNCVDCGNHIRHAMHDLNLSSVVHVFKMEDTIWITEYKKSEYGISRINARFREGITIPSPGEYAIGLLEDLVYITIDLDILSPEDVDASYKDEWEYGWDQGDLRLPVLHEFLEKVFRRKGVIGVDICGMTGDPKAFDVYDGLLEKMDEFEAGRISGTESASPQLITPAK